MLLGLLLIGLRAGTFDMMALATDNGRSLTTSVQVIAVLAVGKGEPRRHPAPVPLTAAIAVTAVLAVALSGAPQLVLRFADTGLF
ncbi:hypothetical protein SFUMM280S_06000 [Streptomyces fumanus]